MVQKEDLIALSQVFSGLDPSQGVQASAPAFGSNLVKAWKIVAAF